MLSISETFLLKKFSIWLGKLPKMLILFVFFGKKSKHNPTLRRPWWDNPHPLAPSSARGDQWTTKTWVEAPVKLGLGIRFLLLGQAVADLGPELRCAQVVEVGPGRNSIRTGRGAFPRLLHRVLQISTGWSLAQPPEHNLTVAIATREMRHAQPGHVDFWLLFHSEPNQVNFQKAKNTRKICLSSELHQGMEHCGDSCVESRCAS